MGMSDKPFYALGGSGGFGDPGTDGAAEGAEVGPLGMDAGAPPGIFGISGSEAPHFLQVLSVGAAASPHDGHVLSMESAAGLKHIYDPFSSILNFCFEAFLIRCQMGIASCIRKARRAPYPRRLQAFCLRGGRESRSRQSID